MAADGRPDGTTWGDGRGALRRAPDHGDLLPRRADAQGGGPRVPSGFAGVFPAGRSRPGDPGTGGLQKRKAALGRNRGNSCSPGGRAGGADDPERAGKEVFEGTDPAAAGKESGDHPPAEGGRRGLGEGKANPGGAAGRDSGALPGPVSAGPADETAFLPASGADQLREDLRGCPAPARGGAGRLSRAAAAAGRGTV